MSDYKQTRDVSGRVTSQYGQMLQNLSDDEELVARLPQMTDEDLIASLRMIHEYKVGLLASDRIKELHNEWRFNANGWSDALARIEELEANINIKADFIDTTINQLAASDQRIEELESKLVKAVEALRCSRETILELVNSRWSETEGTDQDWVGDIDTIIAEIKGSK